MTKQVLTRAECLLDEKGYLDQEPISIHEAVSAIVGHLYVRQKETGVDIAPDPQPVQRSSGKAQRDTTPAGLTKNRIRRRAPLGLTDSQAKRHVARSFARLGQALERKGHGYIGLNVYEKPVNGLLHGHALLHVRRDCLSVVKRWADRFDERPPRLREQVESVALHARPAVRSDLAYILKQRLFNGPFERPSQPWQASAPFAGTRVSFTKMARLIIEEAERRQSKSEKVPPHSAAENPITGCVPDLARAA